MADYRSTGALLATVALEGAGDSLACAVGAEGAGWEGAGWSQLEVGLGPARRERRLWQALGSGLAGSDGIRAADGGGFVY